MHGFVLNREAWLYGVPGLSRVTVKLLVLEKADGCEITTFDLLTIIASLIFEPKVPMAAGFAPVIVAVFAPTPLV